MSDCIVYVDADNQAAALGPALLRALRGRGLVPLAIELFGHTKGPHLSKWSQALRGLATAPVHATPVPCRSQAADVALLLALGARLDQHVQQQLSVVIVSRDNLLLATAQRLQDLGAQVLVCHGPCTPADCKVESLVLPAPGPGAETLSLLGTIRAQVPAEESGGYRKSLVGALLRRAGLDRRGRADFFASVPGLRTQRTAGDRLLFM